MDYVYAVCADSRIDGSAPGYFALCITDTEESANRLKDLFYNVLSVANGSEEYELLNSRYVFGYEEGITWNYRDKENSFYVCKIPVIPSSNNSEIFYKYIKNTAERIVRQDREWHKREQERKETETRLEKEKEDRYDRLNTLIRQKNIEAMEELDDEN